MSAAKSSPALTVNDLFMDTVRRMPNAMAYADQHLEKDYKSLETDVERCAVRLANSGVSRGHRVALIDADGYDMVVLLLAVWWIGGVTVPVNRTQPKDTIVRIINKSQPSYAVVGDDWAEWSGGVSVVEIQPLHRDKLVLSDLETTLPSLSASAVSAESDAMILFTSGTTGTPKGVLHSHEALTLNAMEMSAMFGLNESHRLYMNIPLYFSNSISHFLMAVFRGACLCYSTGFQFGEGLLREAESMRANVFGGVPS
ncbi:MAG: class I adenylate-forming enzyme family protein, partial [Pseudomonadota bacterium]